MIDYVLLIVSAFLAVSFIHGIFVGRKVNTFKRFAVGEKNFKTSTLVATIIATLYSGGFLSRYLIYTQKEGLYFALTEIGGYICFLIFSQFMALRMKEFLPHLSVAESMGVLFGNVVRIITAIAGILGYIGVIAIQIKVIAEIFHMWLGLQHEQSNLALFIGAGIILLYSIQGGIHSVTFTDVVQFTTFGVVILLLTTFVGIKIGSLKAIITLFTEHKNFNLPQMVGTPKFMNTIALLFVHMIPGLNPALLQRVYMSSSVWQVRKIFNYSAFVGPILDCIVFFLGILVFISNPLENPTSKDIINYLLSIFPVFWFKGVFVISILALAMSTADSYLNTAAVLFANDIAPFLKLRFITKNKLFTARLFTLVMGSLGIWVASYQIDFLSLALFKHNFYSPLIKIPFIMAVFGFRPRTLSVLLGMGVGAITTICFRRAGLIHFNNTYQVAIAMLMNLVFLVGSYYVLPKIPNTGWIGIKEKDPLIQAVQERKRKWKAFVDAIKNFNLHYYVRQFFPNNKTILWVGTYIFIVVVIQLFTLKNLILDLSFFVVPMVVGLLLVIYPTLYTVRLHNNINIVVTYSWPVLLGSLFYLLQGQLMHICAYQVVPSCIFLINIFVGIMLFPWSIVLSMVVVSLYIIKKIALCNGGVCMLAALQDNWREVGWDFSVILLFFFIISIILIVYKQRFVKLLQKIIYLDQEKTIKIQEQLAHMQYQHHLDLLTTSKGEENVLQHITQELNVLLKNSHISSKEKEVIQNSLDRLMGYRDFIQKRTYYERYHIPLNVSTVSLERLINKVFCSFSLLQIQLKPLIHRHTQKEMIQCDPNKVEELLCMSVQWIHQQEKGHTKEYIVKLYILDTMLRYTLNKQGTSQDLAAVAFVVTTMSETPNVASLYDGLTTKIVPITFNTVEDLYRQRMLQIVDSHYGCFSNISESEGHTLLHVLPLQLNDIRDAIMNTLPKKFHSFFGKGSKGNQSDCCTDFTE